MEGFHLLFHESGVASLFHPLSGSFGVFQVYPIAGLIKMRSRLGTQFIAFFRLIARILTFRDKKYHILTFRDKKYRILTFHNKKYRILMFHNKKYRILKLRDKTESYLTVLQQNNAEEY